MIAHRTRNEHDLAPIEVRIPCASLTLEGMLADSVPTRVEEDRTIRESQQRQETQAKTGLLPKLAAQAHEKGLSLFEYLADLALEDVGASRFLSLE